MNRKLSVVILLTLWLQSCENANQSAPSIDTASNTDTPKLSVDSVVTAPVIHQAESTEELVKLAETTLRMQLETYMLAFSSGDKEKVLQFIYPGTFQFLKDKYPDQNTDEIVDRVIASQMAEIKSFTEKNNAVYKCELGRVSKLAADGSTMVCILPTKLITHSNKGDDSQDGQVICISENSGANWKFLQNDDVEKSKIIIRQNFSSNIYTKLFE